MAYSINPETGRSWGTIPHLARIYQYKRCVDFAQVRDGMLLHIFVPGTVMGQPRATPIRRGKFTKMIEAPGGHGIHDWKAHIRSTAFREKEQAYPHCGPIAIEVWADFARPAKLQTPKYAELPLLHTSKPDDDNLLKAIQDALNGIIWDDDRRICDAKVVKRYAMPGETPGAHITVRAIGKEIGKNIWQLS